MRIAMLVKRFDPTGTGSPWLTDHLARALLDRGHTLTVLHYDAGTDAPLDLVDGRLTYHRRPYPIGRGSRATAALRHLRALLSFAAALRSRHDVVVNFTMFALFFPLGPLVRLLRRGRYMGFVFDFYPIQFVQSGRRVPWIVGGPLYLVEHLEFLAMQHLFVMTEDNYTYASAYHRGLQRPHSITRLWRPEPADEGPPRGRAPADEGQPLRVVFGGQLERGRGLESLLDAADLLLLRGSTIQIVVAGDGPLRAGLEARCVAGGLTNVTFTGQLASAGYATLLAGCDVGLVTLDAAVDSPSFPSKTLDYMAFGVPILAAVPTTDFARMLTEEARAGRRVTPDDPEQLAAALDALDRDREALREMSANARAFLRSELSPGSVARTMESACRP